MADSIPILWPDAIEVDVVPPVTILRAQIEPLRRKTGGIVEAALSISHINSFVKYNMNLVAPALNGFRQRILSVMHHEDFPYPVKVENEFSMPRWLEEPRGANAFAAVLGQLNRSIATIGPTSLTSSPGVQWVPNAATQHDFIRMLSMILGSGDVQGLIESLIAKSRGFTADRDPGHGSGPSPSQD